MQKGKKSPVFLVEIRESFITEANRRRGPGTREKVR
jgi:hypothetical protein